MLDRLFIKFLTLFFKLVSLFVPKPKYDSVDIRKVDKENW